MPFLLLLVFSVATLALSLMRFRTVVHPHFLFTLSWVFLLPIGALVSPELPSDLSGYGTIPLEEMVTLNLTVLAMLSLLFTITFLAPQNRRLVGIKEPLQFFQISPQHARSAAAVGAFIVAAGFIAQLRACSWSVDVWFSSCFEPRFERPWGLEAVGGDDYFRRLISIVTPASQVLLVLAFFKLRGFWKPLVASAWLLGFGMQVSDGSRTPMAFSLGCLTLAVLSNLKASYLRSLIVAGIVTVYLFLSATMLSLRGVGLRELGLAPGERPVIEYAQDDNYYRLLAILNTDRQLEVANAWRQGQDLHWDAGLFFEAVFLNPIPRHVWRGKPLLTEDFYGIWKERYVTVSWAGEMVAMFGTVCGLLGAVIIGFLLYTVLCRVYEALVFEYGAFLYMGCAFYIFMALRSLHNIGIYMLFMTAVLLVFLFGKRRRLIPDGVKCEQAQQ